MKKSGRKILLRSFLWKGLIALGGLVCIGAFLSWRWPGYGAFFFAIWAGLPWVIIFILCDAYEKAAALLPEDIE